MEMSLKNIRDLEGFPKNPKNTRSMKSWGIPRVIDCKSTDHKINEQYYKKKENCYN